MNFVLNQINRQAYIIAAKYMVASARYGDMQHAGVRVVDGFWQDCHLCSETLQVVEYTDVFTLSRGASMTGVDGYVKHVRSHIIAGA